MTHDMYLPVVDDVRAHLTDLRDDGKLPPGTLYIVVADFHGFAGLAVFIDNVPADQPDHHRTQLLTTSLRALAEVTSVHGALLAVRPGGSRIDVAISCPRAAVCMASPSDELTSAVRCRACCGRSRSRMPMGAGST
jgi:hypothetical protein